MAKDELTPMMRQFHDMKATNPDAILLFRCGDFYETYCGDAVTASQVLGITLTRRNQKGSTAEATEMAGFPYHALDNYLPRLIRAGYRVAICDQLEDPKLTKKLVKRGITELVTPGVALGDNVLNSRENNFLAAIHFGASAIGLSLLDISTGEFLVAEGKVDYIDKLLSGFSPKEVLIERGTKDRYLQYFDKSGLSSAATGAGRGKGTFVFEMEDWAFTDSSAREKVLKHFKVKNLKGFGVDHLRTATTAAGAILTYLDQTQHHRKDHITVLRRIEEERFMRLDKFTVRNLELVGTTYGDGRSLLDVLDKTLTPMGARMLRRWVLFPLRSVKDITTRQDSVEHFFRQPDFRELCEMELAKIGDLERIVSKVATERVNPREMQQLRVALETTVILKNACLSAVPHPAGREGAEAAIREIGLRLDNLTELRQRIERELRPDPPLALAKGGVIADGVSDALDELREIQRSGKDFLLKLQEREAARTGIQSLKIGFNNVFGYYLEVRNTYKDAVPMEWTRKQTLVGAERYITKELKDYEEKIMGAEEKIAVLEARLYADLVAAAAACITSLQRNAQSISELDCYHSLARVAREQHYVRPVVDDSMDIDIKAGRHPVIETMMPIGESYIANDVQLDPEKQQIIIVTGPNMAGKSALLRQTALIALMAQIGSFVPADAARIGMVDKIFTRVGASDNISVGESTFMVEMTEAASIMNNLSPRSLVLFDELGRGTSTYDGISIAWSIVEHIHEHPAAHARTLFATHYHELNEMERLYSRIKNYNVSVHESDGRIIFLRKLTRGGSEHSFGIHVARLAGMPPTIVSRAEEVLRQLEADKQTEVGRKTPEAISKSAGQQTSFFQLDDPVLTQIRDEILGLDLNNLTPIECLNKLSDIRKILTGK